MLQLQLLVMAPLGEEERKRVEQVFDSVHYAELKPNTTNTTGGSEDVDKDILEKTTVILGWQLPPNVTKSSDLPNLIWHMTPSAGADSILKSPFWQDKQVRERVTLTNNSGVHCSVIPSYVIGMTFNLFQRHKKDFENMIVNQKWDRQGTFYLRELSSATFGILGYGRIGREAARLAKAYGARVIAGTSDGKPKPDHEANILYPEPGDPEGVLPDEYFSTKDSKAFDAFLSQTDVLVISLPSTPATVGLINKDRLAKLKKDAVLINIGRGNIVITDDLAEALESKRLSGAALDVTDPEPLPQGHRLFSMDNVIVTPHMSGGTNNYFKRTVHMLVVNAERLRKGESLLNVVDIDKGY